MKILLKNCEIIDPLSQFNKQTLDVLIVDGWIQEIGTIKTHAVNQEYDCAGLQLMPGFFDLNCNSGDPGYETKEDLISLTAAAAAGGFTGIAVMPATKPVVQNKSAVEYILNKTKGNMVDVLPIGALSKGVEGVELAEMYDMHLAGAVAFSDGNKGIQDDGFMSRALQYSMGFNGVVFSFPDNQSISGKSQINESSNSILLGMKGSPSLAEEMQISRDLFLAKYHDAAIHITNISTEGAVKLIKTAKKAGIKVTCDVAAHNLYFTEDYLSDFNSNYKVKPPLRDKKDVTALIKGLEEGTVDAITTQHTPHEIEFKAVEFESASYGMISLQTTLQLLLIAGLSLPLIVEKLSIAPRKILKKELATIQTGVSANFIVFNPSKKWIFDKRSNFSKSANTPLFNTEIKGQINMVFNNNQFKIYE